MPHIHRPRGEAEAWLDLHTAAGIAVGTSLLVQNQSVRPLQLIESTTQPDSDARGKLVPHLADVVCDGGKVVWAKPLKGLLSVFVQEAGAL